MCAGSAALVLARGDAEEQVCGHACNKGLGPDGIPAQAEQTAGNTSVSILHCLVSGMLDAGWFPTRRRGGTVAKVWKRKARPQRASMVVAFAFF